jgi:hypothetical protein
MFTASQMGVWLLWGLPGMRKLSVVGWFHR